MTPVADMPELRNYRTRTIQRLVRAVRDTNDQRASGRITETQWYAERGRIYELATAHGINPGIAANLIADADLFYR